MADRTTTAIPAGEFEAFEIPPGFFFESFVFGDRLVVFGSASKGLGGVFWAVDQPFETAVNIRDLSPSDFDPGSINQMTYFEGGYYAFPIWAEAEDDLAPTMYESDDGIEWRKAKFESITRQASLRRTPDPPSTLGGSGVSGVAVSGGQIIATGWVSENEATVPVVWTGDGTNWQQTYLPVVEGVTQGGVVAASVLGRIVTLAGGSYYGFGTYYQTPETGWSRVEPSIDDEGSEYWTSQLGASDSYFYRLEYSHQQEARLTRSGDGVVWEEVTLPDVEVESFGFHVSPDDRLSVFDRRWIVEDDSTPTVWSLTADRWTSMTYRGARVITVDDRHVITADDDQIYIYDTDG